MKKSTRVIVIVIAVLVLVAALGFGGYRFCDSHTFRLADEPESDSNLKSEEIQPLMGIVRVWGTEDTEVWFTDVEDPDKVFKINVTSDGSSTVRLEQGRWYRVHGAGTITVRVVTVRIE